MRPLQRIVLMCLCSPLAVAAKALPGLEGGHAKGRWSAVSYPDDSLFREVVGSAGQDQDAELRLKFRSSSGPFSVQADYQLLARFGDSPTLSRDLGELFLVPRALPDDEHRWWDLTHTVSDRDSRLVVQRLDRLHLDYAGEKTVLRFGRQAVSWGNGLIYNPMDFFNPFDPAAVDTEYKLGDDMLYGQYLQDSGDDWQFVSVQRRDGDGDVTGEVSTTALKYHRFGREREYDLLLAEHFDQAVIGFGTVFNFGEAVLRSDIVLADGADDWVASLVASWSWSWVWGGYNVSAVGEYFFNGFGLREDDYTPEKIAAATDLTSRIARGELFTLGRHYLAGSLLVELTPLIHVTPNLFVNLGDGSALAQLVLQWDLAQDWQVLAAANIPLGPIGTEYGGLETGVEDLNLSVGSSVLAQLAWYF